MIHQALAINSPPRDEKATQETRRAIAWGMARVEASDPSQTLGSRLKAAVWECMQDAAQTLDRLPDRERSWLLSADRAAWPEVYHTARERYEAELARIVELKEDREETRMPRLNITDPTAVNRMLTVLGWLQHVRARNQKRVKRDKMIFIALAQGLPLRAVRRLMLGDCTDRAIYMVRTKVLGQIVDAIGETS